MLETQQSSDPTYRVYDYDRRDDEGKLRDLHLDKAIEVTTVPHQSIQNAPKVEVNENASVTTFVESEFFSVYKWNIKGQASFSFNDLSVIDGDGSLVHNEDKYMLKKGTHFIIPVGFGEFTLEGNCQLIVSQT